MDLPPLTPEAVYAIKWVWERIPSEYSTSEYIPVLSWVEYANDVDFVPGIAVGPDLRISIPSEFRLKQDDLEVAIGLPWEVLDQHVGDYIHYKRRKFMFIQGDQV